MSLKSSRPFVDVRKSPLVCVCLCLLVNALNLEGCQHSATGEGFSFKIVFLDKNWMNMNFQKAKVHFIRLYLTHFIIINQCTVLNCT